jgi:hypothetical protein
MIGLNSITADICCEKARKVALFEEENRREPRKKSQTCMSLLKRYGC